MSSVFRSRVPPSGNTDENSARPSHDLPVARQLSRQLRKSLFHVAHAIQERIVAFSFGSAKSAERLKSQADLRVKEIDRMTQLLLDRGN